MSTPTLTVSPLDHDGIRARVEDAIAEFLTAKAESAAAAGLPAEVVAAVRSFVCAGGKRLRPLFCVLGWYAGGGDGLPPAVVRVAAAVELFHAAILIHDDIIDDSDTRRDRPTVHRAVAARARQVRERADADRFGAHAAILIGDFGLVWSQELLHTAGLPAARSAAAATVLDTMRTEVNYGQYLDLLTTGRPTRDLERALEIIRYKTAAYTVHRPLQLGAVIAGADADAQRALAEFGRPLGEAFQLQDDLLGVFGDPARTGKSVVSDLRDGKHTALLALALRHGTAGQCAQLDQLVGNPRLDERGAAICREILDATARPEVERMIAERWERVREVLATAPLPPAAVAGLRAAAAAVIARTA